MMIIWIHTNEVRNNEVSDQKERRACMASCRSISLRNESITNARQDINIIISTYCEMHVSVFTTICIQYVYVLEEWFCFVCWGASRVCST